VEGVKDIVHSINHAIHKSFLKNGVANVFFYGLADTVTSKNQSFPVFFKKNDGTWAGLDDKKAVLGYHKINSVVSAPAGKGYGDSSGEVSNTYNMSLVVFFNSTKTKLMRDEMYAFLHAVIPEVLRTEDSKFSYIRTSVSSAILNSQQVFQQEYRGIAYSLKPEHSLISISYLIESRFKKGCFNCCSEG
jgi:hypothetical protein